jgi:hypothetical protein
MTLISTVTLGSNAANIDLQNIPQTFTDLMLVMSLRGVNASVSLGVQLGTNGGFPTANYRILEGSGSGTPTSGSAGDIYVGFMPGSSATSNTFGNTSVYFPNYAGATNKFYSADSVTENNATAAKQGILAGLISSTAAISRITIYDGSSGQNIAAGSSASIYGILKGSGGATVS